MNEGYEEMRGHPVRAGIADIKGTLAGLAGASFFGLSDDEVVEELGRAQEALWQAEELFIRLVGEMDARGAGVNLIGAKSTKQVLTGWRLRMAPDKATRTLKLARALRRSAETGSHGGEVTRPGLNRIRRAWAQGRFGLDHAGRCADALAKLPDELSPYQRRRAEQSMVTNASKFNPPDTTRLKRHLLHVLDPGLADRLLEKQLEKEEKRARRDRALWFRDTGHGRVQFGGWLDAAAAARLRTALDPVAWATQKSELQTQIGDSKHTEGVRSRSQRLADALVDLAETAMRSGEVPSHAGEPTQLVVTIALKDLVEGVNAAYLPTGDAISATQARIMACDARIIPVVLDSAGVPLDAGQGKRTFTGKLRKALELRDQGCAFPHCTAPATWCDGHHIRAWLDGGATSLDNGVLLCRHHHRIVHTENWHIRLAPDRRPEFIPPPWIDPDQQPLRNPRTTPTGSASTDTTNGTTNPDHDHLADAA